jgi:hypothetical protein
MLEEIEHNNNTDQSESKEKKKEKWYNICKLETTKEECRKCMYENLCHMKIFNSQKEYNN